MINLSVTCSGNVTRDLRRAGWGMSVYYQTAYVGYHRTKVGCLTQLGKHLREDGCDLIAIAAFQVPLPVVRE